VKGGCVVTELDVATTPDERGPGAIVGGTVIIEGDCEFTGGNASEDDTIPAGEEDKGWSDDLSVSVKGGRAVTGRGVVLTLTAEEEGLGWSADVVVTVGVPEF